MTNNHDRFIEKTNEDGTKTINDLDNNYRIEYSEGSGYIAYDENDNEVYHIYPDGTASIKMDNGEYVIASGMTIDQMGGEKVIAGNDGRYYMIENGYAEEVKIHNDNPRFIEKLDENGVKTIKDLDNNYTINYSEGNGYVAYDENGNEVYHIYPDGNASIKTQDGDNVIISFKDMTIDQMGANKVIADNDGHYYMMDNGYAEEVKVHNGNPRFIEKLDENGVTIIRDIESGYNIKYSESDGYIAYDENGKEVYHIYPDGNASIKTQDGENIVIYFQDMTIDKMGTDTIVTDSNHHYFTMENGYAEELTVYNNNPRFLVKLNTDGTRVIKDVDNGYNIKCTEDNDYIAYDKSGKEVYRLNEEGILSFTTSDGGVVFCSNKYTIEDMRSNMVIFDRNGNVHGFNGSELEEINDFDRYPRFYEKKEYDGSVVTYDLKNNYKIKDDGSGGIIAYDDLDYEVYHVFSDGRTTIKTRNGTSIDVDTTIEKDQFSHDMTVRDKNGNVYVVTDGRVIEKTDTNNVVSEYYYENDRTYRVESSDGEKVYYKDNKECRHDYNDGNYTMLDTENNLFHFNKDGTYTINDDNSLRGSYTVRDDGSFVTINEDGETRIYDVYGENTKYITSDGIEYDYVYDRKSQSTTNSRGYTYYSRINHIEYDEEAYDKILTTFKNIEDTYSTSLIRECSNIDNAISNFPDTFSDGSIEGISGSIQVHMGLIVSLNEMTNYSLLAYQTCDDSLKKNLESLIDSLFGDSDANLGNRFKKAINYSIEEKHGIKEYKEETNFWKTEYLVDLLLEHPNAEVLEGDELNEFIGSNNIRDLETLVVSKEIVNFNGVDMPVYRVVDTEHLDYVAYEKYISMSNNEIANVDSQVLQYMSDTGAKISYFSGYTVDNGLYDKDGVFREDKIYYAGYASPYTLNTVSVAVYKPITTYDASCILHELGHTLDHCIFYNQTGKEGTTTDVGYDYSNMPGNTRELAHLEYFAYQDGYVYLDDYSNCGQYHPSEFFAESFRNYYTTDEEKRMEFADKIPQTFEFFDRVEEWTGEQNGNK